MKGKTKTVQIGPRSVLSVTHQEAFVLCDRKLLTGGATVSSFPWCLYPLSLYLLPGHNLSTYMISSLHKAHVSCYTEISVPS